jgi:hypothetical protein
MCSFRHVLADYANCFVPETSARAWFLFSLHSLGIILGCGHRIFLRHEETQAGC